ncbi:MAG TPA: chromosome condensation protein CrcB, partial [Micrococcus luteus]|nr:chromosome condensation protein CrcB [Micrococcus luteus]
LVAAVSAVVSGFCLALGTWSTVAAEAADAVLARRWGAAARLWTAHLGLGLVAVVVGWGAGLGLHAVLAG